MTFGQQTKPQASPVSFHSALSEIPALGDFQGGEFALFFENCEPSGMVTFDIRVALYNVGSSGNKDYLAVGEDLLPSLYMVGSASLPPQRQQILCLSLPTALYTIAFYPALPCPHPFRRALFDTDQQQAL